MLEDVIKLLSQNISTWDAVIIFVAYFMYKLSLSESKTVDVKYLFFLGLATISARVLITLMNFIWR